MRKVISLLIAASILLAGCTRETGGDSIANLRAWFDAPLAGSKYPLGPVEVIAHGAAPGGVAQLEISVDGDVYDAKTPDEYADYGETTKLAKASWIWYPTLPGQYTLAVRARSQGSDWSQQAETTVVILPLELPDTGMEVLETPPILSSTPTSTPTPTATPTVTPTAQLASISNGGASTGQVFYGGTSCTPAQVTFNALAAHPEGVEVVVFFYRLVDQTTGDTTAWSTGQAMQPGGGGNYSLTLTGDQLARPMGFAGNNATVRYQFALQPTQGETLRSPVYSDLTLSRCVGVIIIPGRIYTPTPTVIVPR